MSAKQENTKGMRWPENCIWPEPENPDALGSIWDPEDAQGMPLDPEGRAVAEEKRKAFDLPTNAVKVDPLR